MNQTIKISIDASELIDSLSWDVPRKDIKPDGVRDSVGSNGVVVLRMNGHPVMSLFIHEDVRGSVVVDAIAGAMESEATARFYPQDAGFVPPRSIKLREE